MDRPNVLLLLEDQLRYDVVDREELYRTPTLDALRAESVFFRQAYTPAGICSPARGSLFTGLYPHAHGLLNNIHGTDAIRRDLPRQHTTVAESLHQAGYRTGYVSKWHLGMRDGPQDRGFEEWRASDDYLAEDELFRPYWSKFSERTPDAVFTRYATGPSNRFPRVPFPLYAFDPVPEEIVPARAVLDEASAIMDAYGRGRKPFFLVVSFLEPHWPNVLPEAYASMYDPASIPPWPNFDDPFHDKPRTNVAGMRHFGVEDFAWEDWQPVVARYLGAVSFLDEIIGRFLRRLAEIGLADETVVIVSTDHGDMTGSHRQFNKGPLMYEEVYHVPLVIRGPGFPPGTTSDALTSHVDLMPTLLDLCGVPPIESHGRSLLSLVRREETSWRDSLMREFHGDEFGLYSQRMLRKERYKLVYNPNDVSELYDLAADPFELRNLALAPEHQELRRALEGDLFQAMLESEDPLREWAVNVLG